MATLVEITVNFSANEETGNTVRALDCALFQSDHNTNGTDHLKGFGSYGTLRNLQQRIEFMAANF